ncbi:lamin-like protein [Trifolium medium]|uniref:Lamin-like protein n=1 Tax=Trifolium medium TaxID=97028 RepID=A0A392MJA0_9FABA|nr:lamin-like protein [Trifolium medium]
MGFGRKIIVCLLMIITIGCNEIDGREPVLHRVGGGKYTWKPKINFTQWASNEHFYKDDWLYFGFDKHIYNVLEVNKTNYEKCIDTGYINNITRGGRDVFQLSEERTYYFLCGRGFCFQGMKVEINVEPLELPLLPPPTIPNKAGSSRNTNYSIFVILLVIALAWIFM